MTPDDRIAELEGLVRQQRQQLDVVLAQNAVLQARVQELEARLAKDSHNSGKCMVFVPHDRVISPSS